MTHVLYVFADSASEWNCSAWRCLTPADIINRSGKHTAKLLHISSFCDYGSQAVQDIVGPANIIIVQRNIIDPVVYDAIDYWRGLKRPVVADLDDDYPNLPWSNPAHEFWIRNTHDLPESPIALLTNGLRHVDALTSPSKVILNDWKDVVPGFHVPNWAQGEWYLNLPKRPKDDKIIIGWGGSVSHFDSWVFSQIKPALEKLCREHPNVVVKICGNDSRLNGFLNIPKEQIIMQPGVDAKDWAKIIATFDIGLAPLDMKDGNKSYDNRRSWIKALEYLLVGVPWVASKSDVYVDLAQYGKVVDNVAYDWYNALNDTVKNLDFLKRQARRNRRVGYTLTMSANVDKLIETYERIQAITLPQLPSTFYVHWTTDGKTLNERRTQIKATPIEKVDRPAQSVLDEAQVAAMVAAQAWTEKVAYQGIDLVTPMRYEAVQQFNRYLLAKVNEHE